MIALMGPPPPELLAQGTLTSKFFLTEGTFIAGVEVLPIFLEDAEITLTNWALDDEGDLFLRFMRKMLQ
ncbi:hypothetical protein C0995_006335 [Termitomyces sp. Mi166|nr:hypothetical protein C0995_006335 [Termitomyces sp. Mi166\